MKIFKYALCFAAIAIMLTACGSVKTVSFEPIVSSIFLKRDLSAKSVIIEDATAAYYNEDWAISNEPSRFHSVVQMCCSAES